jgi:hypothetical protein
MILHGITTSKADFWIHLHPLEKDDIPTPALYWYAVALCLRFIARNKLPIKIAESKDGAATGSGYLIPKNSLFVTRRLIPQRYAALPWTEMTDREAGLLGQDIVKLMIERNETTLPSRVFRHLESREDQYAGCDFELQAIDKTRFEVKTERVLSPYLFVQHGEEGHRVHLTPDGDTRHSEIGDLA